MKRVHLNFAIDLAAFLALLMLISTGMLIAFRLPPGSGGHESYGRGWRAMERSTPEIWELTRHQWGEIHFWIAITFALLLAFHLALHWKWIVATVKNLAPRAMLTTLLVWLIGILSVALIFAPLLIPKRERIQTRPTSGTSTIEKSASDGQTTSANWVGSILPVSKRLR